jgi:phosphoinositide-3-kinase regulatory subunit 4
MDSKTHFLWFLCFKSFVRMLCFDRIAVCDEQPAWFATCSNDGSVKLFDCVGIEGRSKISKSRLTYKQEGQVKAVTFCQGAQSLAFASDNGTIQVLR